LTTVYAIRPEGSDHIFQQMCAGFKVDYKAINHISEVKGDNIVVFHPHSVDNPSWVKLEDFDSILFKHSKDASYVFGSDEGNIVDDIECHNMKDRVRFVSIPCKNGLSLHATTACAIALYDLYMENN